MDAVSQFTSIAKEVGQRRRAAELLLYQGAKELEAALERERQQRKVGFLLTRALTSLTSHGYVDGADREVLDDAAQRAGESFDPHRPIIPLQLLSSRTLTAGSGGAGLVGDVAQPVADALLPESVALRLGAQVIPVGPGEHVVPAFGTNATAAWVGETATAAASDAVFSGTPRSPKRLAAFVQISKQLLIQSAIAEEALRRHLRQTLAAKLDQACLGGAGGAEPTGVVTAAGTSTSGASFNAATAASLLAAVNDGNAPAPTFVAPPAVAQALRVRVATGGSIYLWSGARLLDTPATVTTNMPAATVLCGDFRQLVILAWGGGIELMIDRASGFKSDVIGLRASMYVDLAVPYPQAFAVATSVT